MEHLSPTLTSEQNDLMEQAYTKRLLYRSLTLLSKHDYMMDYKRSVFEYLETFSSLEHAYNLHASSIFFGDPGTITGTVIQKEIPIEEEDSKDLIENLVDLESNMYLGTAPNIGIQPGRLLRMVDKQEHYMQTDLDLRSRLAKKYGVSIGFSYNFVRNCIVV